MIFYYISDFPAEGPVIDVERKQYQVIEDDHDDGIDDDGDVDADDADADNDDYNDNDDDND